MATDPILRCALCGVQLPPLRWSTLNRDGKTHICFDRRECLHRSLTRLNQQATKMQPATEQRCAMSRPPRENIAVLWLLAAVGIAAVASVVWTALQYAMGTPP
jgi:hypothetical protein